MGGVVPDDEAEADADAVAVLDDEKEDDEVLLPVVLAE